MRRSGGITTALLLIGPALAMADPWKDESGKGRGGPPGWARGEGGPPPWAPARGRRDARFRDGRGETPDWARGRGYWDGHFRERDRFHNRGPDWARRGYGDDFGYDEYGGYGGYGGYDREWYRYREPYYDAYGYDGYRAPPRYGTGYRGYPPYYRDRDDDLDAVYTPFGFYQEIPRSPYGGPQPKARGRIGPIPFEVWDDD